MIQVPAGNFCDNLCCMAFINGVYSKRLEKSRQADKTKKKESRAAVLQFNRQDVRWQHKQTQKAFNRMRVLEELAWFAERGQEPTCISCGRPKGGDQWSCGHFKTVGAQGGLRYDRVNTCLQHLTRCNKNLSGDIEGTKTTHGYKLGLANRFGETQGMVIIDYCETHTAPVKWEWQQLEEMRKEFNVRIRALEKALL